MDRIALPAAPLQLVGGAHFKGEKRKVVKARHLRRPTRALLVRHLQMHQSATDAAKGFGEPGITGSVVVDSTLLDLLERVGRVEQLLAVQRAA